MKREGQMDRTERLHVPTGDTCNNRCMFCMEYPRKTGQIPDNALVRRQLDENRHLSKVIFTAGEPTLNKDLEARIKYAKELGYSRICLVTNGRLLADKEFCRRLLFSGLDDVMISIRGNNAKVHDTLTGVKGSYEQSIRAVRNFSDLRDERTFYFFLSTVVNKLNISTLPEIASYFTSFNIDQELFQRPRIAGRALKYFDRIVPSLTDIAAAFKLTADSLERELVLSRPVSKIGFSCIPHCLMYEYEMYIWTEEIVFRLERSDTATERIEFMSPLTKRDECEHCVYNPICPGVDVSYVERFGWSDAFLPRKKYSATFNEYLEKPPEAETMYLSSGLLKDDKNRISNEIRSMCEELRTNPELSDEQKADKCFEIGNLYQILGQPEDALNYLNYTIRIKGFHGGAYFKKGMTLLALGKREDAARAFHTAERCGLDLNTKVEIHKYKSLLSGMKNKK